MADGSRRPVRPEREPRPTVQELVQRRGAHALLPGGQPVLRRKAGRLSRLRLHAGRRLFLLVHVLLGRAAVWLLSGALTREARGDRAARSPGGPTKNGLDTLRQTPRTSRPHCSFHDRGRRKVELYRAALRWAGVHALLDTAIGTGELAGRRTEGSRVPSRRSKARFCASISCAAGRSYVNRSVPVQFDVGDRDTDCGAINARCRKAGAAIGLTTLLKSERSPFRVHDADRRSGTTGAAVGIPTSDSKLDGGFAGRHAGGVRRRASSRPDRASAATAARLFTWAASTVDAGGGKLAESGVDITIAIGATLAPLGAHLARWWQRAIAGIHGRARAAVALQATCCPETGSSRSAARAVRTTRASGSDHSVAAARRDGEGRNHAHRDRDHHSLLMPGVHGPSVPLTTVLEGKSKSTEPHFSGPVVVQCGAPPSRPVSTPGVAQYTAMYFPGGAKVCSEHDVPEPQVDVA